MRPAPSPALLQVPTLYTTSHNKRWSLSGSPSPRRRQPLSRKQGLLTRQIKVKVRRGVANPRGAVLDGMAENTEGSVDSNSSKTDKTPEFRFSRAPSLEDMLVPAKFLFS